MTDKTQPDAGSTHIIRYALEMGLLWIDGDGRDKVREALAALDALEAQLSAIGAGGVSGPIMGQPQAMPDLSALTERGAKAWAGVDAQGLRDGAASAGSEPVATIKSWTNGSYWRNYNVVFHRDDLPVGTDLYLHPSPPEGMVGGWIASKDQMPPPGVRVFWGDVDSNRVGYDSWAGDDYRWTPSHWMHIPEFPAPPTTSAGSEE